MASMVLAFLAVAHGCMNVLVLVWTILLVSVDKESPSENAIYWIGAGPTPAISTSVLYGIRRPRHADLCLASNRRSTHLLRA